MCLMISSTSACSYFHLSLLPASNARRRAAGTNGTLRVGQEQPADSAGREVHCEVRTTKLAAGKECVAGVLSVADSPDIIGVHETASTRLLAGGKGRSPSTGCLWPRDPRGSWALSARFAGLCEWGFQPLQNSCEFVNLLQSTGRQLGARDSCPQTSKH